MSSLTPTGLTPSTASGLSNDELPALTISQRWQLLLGESVADPQGEEAGADLAPAWKEADAVVGELYDEDRRGSMAKSSAKITDWLVRLRENFPAESVQLMQRDALERYGLSKLLEDPAILESLEPDIHLAATLIQLGKSLPDAARAKAEAIVAHIARLLTKQLEEPLLRSLRSALASAELRTQAKPTRHTDWHRTIQRNLKHYQPEWQAIVPERFVNRNPLARGLRHVHVLVDQSASMATSAIYAALGAAIMTKVPALNVRLVAFDTEIADLTGMLHDPVETLFGVQLGGGTDIHRAICYEEQFIREPARSLVLLITDLYEGGSRAGLLQRLQALLESGVRVICLLAINEEGRPSFDKALAAQLAELGAAVFSTTPTLFPDMMGAAIRGESLEGYR